MAVTVDMGTLVIMITVATTTPTIQTIANSQITAQASRLVMVTQDTPVIPSLITTTPVVRQQLHLTMPMPTPPCPLTLAMWGPVGCPPPTPTCSRQTPALPLHQAMLTFMPWADDNTEKET